MTMSWDLWPALVLAVAVALGTVIIWLVRKSRPAIESYRRTTGGPRILRVFVEQQLRPVTWSYTVLVLILAALGLWAGTYLGWLTW